MNGASDGLPDIDGLWDYQDPAGSRGRFQGILPAAEAADHHDYLAELLTQIARTEGLQDRFDEATSILDQVEAALTDEVHRPRIRYLLERGRVFNSSGSPKQSKPYFLEAYELARANGEDYLTIDAIHMLAIVEAPEKQIEWALLGLDLAQRTIDERAAGWRGPLYNNLGWTYYDLGRYDEALPLFQSGLEWREQHRQKREARIAAKAVAECLRSLGRAGEAQDVEARYAAEGEAADS